MRSRLMTQVGQRLMQKVWKWAEALEVEARLQKDMGSQGTNHDTQPLILLILTHTTHQKV